MRMAWVDMRSHTSSAIIKQPVLTIITLVVHQLDFPDAPLLRTSTSHSHFALYFALTMIFSTTLALLVSSTFAALARAQKDPASYPSCSPEGNIVNIEGPLPKAATYVASVENGDYWVDPETKDIVIQWIPELSDGWDYTFINHRQTSLYVGVEWKDSDVVRHSIFALGSGDGVCHVKISDKITTVGLYDS
jgi:hypothetical protein